MPFVLDDILISAVVVPVAKRLGQRWLDEAANQIDAGLRKVLASVVDADVTEDAERRAELAERAEEELKLYVREHPETSDQVAALATPPVSKVSKGPVARAEELFDFLTYTFSMVEYLEQPVGLPGFFTSADDFVIIDVRPELTSSATTFRLPARSWEGFLAEEKNPMIWVEVSDALTLEIPRIWLIEAADSVQARIADLNNELSPTDPSPGGLELNLKDDWRVSAISPHEVRMVKFFSGAERVSRIAGPEGAVVLRDALLRAVAAKGRDDERWREALLVPGTSPS